MATNGRGDFPVRSPKITRRALTKQRAGNVGQTVAAEFFFTQPATVTGSAALTGVGSSTITGTRTAGRTAALTGLGSSTISGARSALRTADLTGIGSGTFAGIRTALQSALLAGAGTLTATGTNPVAQTERASGGSTPHAMFTPLYSCRVCGKRFRTGAELLAHREQQHTPKPATTLGPVVVIDATPRIIAADDELLLAGVF